jgi:1-hydroxycarotenoid 3,4-desaturase
MTKSLDKAHPHVNVATRKSEQQDVTDEEVVIVGAGFGGLSAALALANSGCRITVIESAASAGGKARTISAGGFAVAAGPTVLTMRPVFETLFASLGEQLEDHVTLTRAEIIARHYWDGGNPLDLYADPVRSRDAIGIFAGADAARGYDRFRDEARRIYETLDAPFMRASRTNPIGLSLRIGAAQLGKLWGIKPWEPMWSALGRHFRDPRLRQLFARYATYTGSSPFAAPATLMLIAHVEAEGVWLIDGGMKQLAQAMASLAERRGVTFRFGETCESVSAGRVALASGEELRADHIIFNGDPSRAGGTALKASTRSLSAMVWTGAATAGDFPLSHHNVFFSPRYRAEFDSIRAGKLPADPSIYVCAQDRGGTHAKGTGAAEPMQFIVNAPANGDTHHYSEEEIHSCQNAILTRFQSCGLRLTLNEGVMTTPTAFNARFPGTGGALYGRATHGAMAAFMRPGARTKTAGLYLCGGATHPGAGVPMATLSGLQAASALLADRASTRRSHPVAMPGGISTQSAMTGSTD